MDTTDLKRWLTAYVDVWNSGDQSRVSELFSDDAVYVAAPFDPPIRGHAAIAELWQRNGDAPGTFEAEYEPIAALGDVAVASGVTRYFNAERTEVQHEYANVFVLRFAADGRCSEYREWYMPRTRAEAPAPATAGA